MKFEKRKEEADEVMVESFKNHLYTVSDYDHTFIELISEIYKKYKLDLQNVEDLFYYVPESKLQLFANEIFDEPEFVLNSKYNQTQLQIIAQSKDLDLSWIEEHLPPDVPFKKMEWILVAISKGHSYFKDNVDTLVKFDHEQLYELFAGAESGINYHEYANIGIDARLMRAMRYCMEQGLEVKVNADLDSFSARV